MNPEINPEKPDEVPPIPHCAADAVLLLNQIGEFEQASALTRKLQNSSGAIDPILEKLFSEQQHRSLSRQASFNEVNKQGIQFYKESNYEQALIRFEQALEIAPMNTGSALNYIQTAIQNDGRSETEEAVGAGGKMPQNLQNSRQYATAGTPQSATSGVIAAV